MSESTAVATEAVRTIRNFPRTRCVREIGLQRIVSIVPRSFSPAVRSMAGIHRACQAQQNNEIGDQSAEDCAADFFRRGHVLLLDIEGLDEAFGELARAQIFPDGPVAQVAKEFLQAVGAETGF